MEVSLDSYGTPNGNGSHLNCQGRSVIRDAAGSLSVEEVLSVARTGAPWRDLPDEFGKWYTVYTRFWRWAQSLRIQISNTSSSMRRWSLLVQCPRQRPGVDCCGND